MKKVAVVLDSYPHIGGAHTYAHLILDALIADKEVELFAICTNAYWRSLCRKNGIRYYSAIWPSAHVKYSKLSTDFGRISRCYNMNLTRLGQILGDEKADILFLTSQLIYLPPLKCKVILPVHDLMHRYEPTYPEVANYYDYREKILKQQARYADIILTDSLLGVEQYKESYSKYMSKNQEVHALPFVTPVHMQKYKEEYIEVPEKFIFYPAQFWSHKNHINLIKAIELVKDEISDIHLILPGSEKNNFFSIKEYVEAHNLQGIISLPGYISDEQLTYLYTHAIAMFMPSVFGPTNIPPIEAMALGCPVAVSDNYAMPEQVGDAGMTFDPHSPESIADCIRKIWSDTQLREKMSARGLEIISKWTPEDFKAKVQQLISKL